LVSGAPDRGNGVAKAQLEITGSGMLLHGRSYLRTSWGEGGGPALSDSPLSMTYRNTTGADGEFEIQVMPGRYGLSAWPPAGLKPPGPAMAWKRTYYPGVDLEEAASKIVVLPGGEAAGIELKLRAVATHAVRGVLLDPDGEPLPKATIMLAGASSPEAQSKADGAFEFPSVPEGPALVLAQVDRGEVKLRAYQAITVGHHDLEDLKLKLAPPFDLTARLTTDSPSSGPPPRLTGLILAIRAGSFLNPGFLGALANPNAKTGIYPGTYRLSPPMQPPQAPYYLDAVRIGSEDVARQDVEISTAATITVVYKSDGGAVRGKAENCFLGGVLLVPADAAIRGRGFSKSAPCDSTGQYEVHAIRPGDYYALAFAGNGPVVEIDDAILQSASKVTVRSGETSQLDLRAVTKPVF